MPQIINTDTTLSQVNVVAQKAKLLASYQALIGAITSDLTDTPSFIISGTTYTRDQLLQLLNSRVTAAKNTLAQRTSMHEAVAAEQNVASQVDPVRAGFKTYLLSRFGKNSAKLLKYGYTPVKPTQKAVSTKSSAVVLNKGTRTLRGTTGKKAKSLIKATPSATGSPPPKAAPGTAAPAAAPAKPASPNPGATA